MLILIIFTIKNQIHCEDLLTVYHPLMLIVKSSKIINIIIRFVFCHIDLCY